jgi:hypothetical protein
MGFRGTPTQLMRTDHLNFRVGQPQHEAVYIESRWFDKTQYFNLFELNAFGAPLGYTGDMSGLNDFTVALSECPGDFNPQTACVYREGGGFFSLGVIAPTSNKDTVKNSTNTVSGGYCEVQGGKTYYVNMRVDQCMGSTTCSTNTVGGAAKALLRLPGLY